MAKSHELAHEDTVADPLDLAFRAAYAGRPAISAEQFHAAIVETIAPLAHTLKIEGQDLHVYVTRRMTEMEED